MSPPVSDDVRRLRLQVRGVVQGVGFRPFVHRLAERFSLGGWVCNTPAGASIEVEGAGEALAEFLVALQREAPSPAVVEGWESRLLEPVGAREFRIRPSLPSGEAGTTTPDGATCDACLREVFDPADRRYRYPFTNCTACGPRFTILLALPYDRVNTTMAAFQMCEACRSEYEAPGDRRFHAQPNACPACGPHLTLLGPDGAPRAEREAALAASAEAIRGGAIVAVKGLGGFHLLVDARSEEAVRRLRARKHREEKPFAVMAPSVHWVERHCELTEPERDLLRSPAAPIVLMKRGDPEAVAPAVAPESPFLGVLLPYTPLHHLLLADLGFPVVATSGNRVDEPLCTESRQAVERLAGIADLILTHNRPIVRPLDDSVARVVAGEPLLLRRARGYVPLPIRIGRPLPPLLALGSQLKNTLALSVGDGVVLSGHHGDLETACAVDAVWDSVVDLTRLYGRRPEAVACDDNPDYASSQVAEQLARVEAVPLVRVQHHHAHVLACRAEHRLEGPVLGVCWDGAGAGGDGTVWGGEFLVVAGSDYRRVAHLRQFRLPGGDQAAREPRRAALGLLLEMLGPAALETELASVRAFTRGQLQVLLTLVKSGIQCPTTSSVGRLFDAVASLLNLRQVSGFEGHAAMALEHAALECRTDEVYPFTLCWQDAKPGVIDWEPLVRALLAEHLAGEVAPRIAAKVHNTLVEAIVAVARRVREPRVVMTGGCFQNQYLTERAVGRLREEGFQPYWQRQVPPNDGGLSLGQVMSAVHRMDGI